MTRRHFLTPDERQVVTGFEDCYDQWWQAQQAARSAQEALERKRQAPWVPGLTAPDDEESKRVAELLEQARQRLDAAIEYLRSNPI